MFSVCDKKNCHHIHPQYRGGFECQKPGCTGTTLEIESYVDLSNPHLISLYRHKKMFTLFTEKVWAHLEEPMPDGAMRIMSEYYLEEHPHFTHQWPFIFDQVTPEFIQLAITMAKVKLDKLNYPNFKTARLITAIFPKFTNGEILAAEMLISKEMA
jgi:hypothetical protein